MSLSVLEFKVFNFTDVISRSCLSYVFSFSPSVGYTIEERERMKEKERRGEKERKRKKQRKKEIEIKKKKEQEDCDSPVLS